MTFKRGQESAIDKIKLLLSSKIPNENLFKGQDEHSIRPTITSLNYLIQQQKIMSDDKEWKQ
jgi:hypothetical protein